MQLVRPPMEFQRKSDPNRSLKDKSSSSSDQQDLNFDDDNLDLDDVPDDDLRSRRRPSTASKRAGPAAGGAAPPSCQAECCPTALSEAKRYHRRHKVCEFHAKAPVAIVAGLRQRFCQQCSRFHELSEFDEAKRSCRRRLAGHNERRRKASTSEGPGEGRKQGSPPPGDQQWRAHQASNSSTSAAANSYKHFQMR